MPRRTEDDIKRQKKIRASLPTYSADAFRRFQAISPLPDTLAIRSTCNCASMQMRHFRLFDWHSWRSTWLQDEGMLTTKLDSGATSLSRLLVAPPMNIKGLQMNASINAGWMENLVPKLTYAEVDWPSTRRERCSWAISDSPHREIPQERLVISFTRRGSIEVPQKSNTHWNDDYVFESHGIPVSELAKLCTIV